MLFDVFKWDGENGEHAQGVLSSNGGNNRTGITACCRYGFNISLYTSTAAAIRAGNSEDNRYQGSFGCVFFGKGRAVVCAIKVPNASVEELYQA